MVADRIKEERTEENQQQHRDNKCDSKRHLLLSSAAFCYGAHPFLPPRIKAMLLCVSYCIMWTCLIEVMDKTEKNPHEYSQENFPEDPAQHKT